MRLKPARSIPVLFSLQILLTILPSCSLDGDLPTCDPNAINLQAIFPTYFNIPADLSSPTFQWGYYNESDGSDATCNPESQHIRFGWRDTTEEGALVYTTLAEQDLGATERSHNFGVDLEPGGSYFWEVTWYADSGAEARSVRIAFNAGPLCSRAELLPPVIRSQPDGAVVDAYALISWVFQGACIPDGVEVHLSSSPDFPPGETEIVRSSFAFHALVGWEPCRVYYWRVANFLIGSLSAVELPPDISLPPMFGSEPLPYAVSYYHYSDFTTPRSFYVIGDTCLLPPPDYGFDPAAPLPPFARLLEDANCRSGPSLDYPVMSILPGGGEYEIQGRNQDGTYWLIFDPAINNTCWVFADLVETLGDTSEVGEVDAGPPPTKVPTAVPTVNCGAYTSPQACDANPACYWDPNYPPQSNGSCRNK